MTRRHISRVEAVIACSVTFGFVGGVLFGPGGLVIGLVVALFVAEWLTHERGA